MVRVVPVRSPTLPPATHTNCYLLGHERITVVDPASPFADEQARLLGGLQAAPGHVERILLTHHHHDHVGGAQALAQALEVPVVAHRYTAEQLAGEVRIDAWLDEGAIVDTDAGSWRCLHTPGHAPGHLCLHHQEAGVVVAGDMVAGEGTIVLDPPEGVLAEYLASLARLRDLGSRVLLPAHGPALKEPEALLSYYIAHRHERTEQVLEALQSLQPAGPLELARRVYVELPELFLGVAARQVLCHLQDLAARDVVCTSGETWRMV